MSAEPVVLTVNAGSSSLRLGLFRGHGMHFVATHHAETNGAEAIDLSDWLHGHAIERPDVVAHRVVHGGAELVAPAPVDLRVEGIIEQYSPLAPLHNPAALRWIRAVRKIYGPKLPQVAAFDTAFYAYMPAAATRYAIPEVGSREPIRRFGFHGIAHEAMVSEWRRHGPAAATNGRTISMQLGAGCSMTAAVDGKPVETSMGFSPLEGLVMSTRCGDLDPGVLLYLQRDCGLSVADLERLLNHESGLLGLSGTSGDMRVLLASRSPAAQLAIEVYCHRVRKYLGAYLAVLGGADAILIGGGVGEGSPEIRERVLKGMEFAGIHLDGERNREALGPVSIIHAGDSAVAIWVLAVDEARFLARAALAVLTPASKNPGPGAS
jgi:acetate kinase